MALPPIEDDDDGRAGGGDALDQFLLTARQPEERAIAELTFLDAGDDDRDVALLRERDGFRNARGSVIDDAGVPEQFQPRVAGALEVLQPDPMRRARRPRDVGHADAVRLLSPVVDDERVVEVQTIAVVALDADAPDARGWRDDAAGPARGVPVERNAAAGGVERPAEIDPRIDAREPRRPVEADVVEVLAAQSRPRIKRGPGPQELGRDHDELARRAPRPGAWRTSDAGDLRADAVENRDRRDSRAAVSAEPRLDRIRADHRDAADGRRERQRLPIVLQQHDRLRGPPRAPARGVRRGRSRARPPTDRRTAARTGRARTSRAAPARPPRR